MSEPHLLQVRYRWFRAEIWDGVRWVRLTRQQTDRQHEYDRLIAKGNALIEKIISDAI
jgi:hypothetical protein